MGRDASSCIAGEGIQRRFANSHEAAGRSPISPPAPHAPSPNSGRLSPKPTTSTLRLSAETTSPLQEYDRKLAESALRTAFYQIPMRRQRWKPSTSSGHNISTCIDRLVVACFLDSTLDGREDVVTMCGRAAATRGGDPGRPRGTSMVSGTTGGLDYRLRRVSSLRETSWRRLADMRSYGHRLSRHVRWRSQYSPTRGLGRGLFKQGEPSGLRTATPPKSSPNSLIY